MLTRLSALLLAASVAASGQVNSQIPGTQQPYLLKTGVQRVLVDVVVRDSQGNPVHGLKASEFTISDSGQAQPIRDFTEHTALSPAEAATLPTIPRLPAGEFTNYVPVQANTALNVILLDRLNTSQVDQNYVFQQLKAYLKQARPDSRTAIYGLTDHLILLQGFSQNPAILLDALDRNQHAIASVLLDDTLGNAPGEGLQSTLDTLNASPQFAGMAANATLFNSETTSFASQLRGKYTLDALNELARLMASIPGRKNLVWFAGSFPEGFFPGDNDPNAPFAQFASLEEEFRDTVNLLTSSQIAIYPMDARGLIANQVNSASEANHSFVNGRSGAGFTGANAALAEDNAIANDHMGMRQIAADTGGQAFLNTNNLTGALAKTIELGSNYYTLSYAPPDTGSSDSFHRITVKLDRSDVKLDYRRGYYAQKGKAPAAAAPGRQQLAGLGTRRSSAMQLAMQPGSPTPSDILIRVRAIPLDKGGDREILAGNVPNPDTAKVKPPYQPFEISFAVSALPIAFEHTGPAPGSAASPTTGATAAPAQTYRADLTFNTVVYSLDGVVLNTQSNTVHTALDAEHLAALLRSGLPFSQRISVPRNAATLRGVLRDNISGKLAAVEIPIVLIAHLPTLAELSPEPEPATGATHPKP